MQQMGPMFFFFFFLGEPTGLLDHDLLGDHCRLGVGSFTPRVSVGSLVCPRLHRGEMHLRTYVWGSADSGSLRDALDLFGPEGNTH